MTNHKIPWEELSGNKNLNGKYKVSFILDLSKEDNISLTDIAHSITTGFEGHPVLYKISQLDLEKTYQDGKTYSQKQSTVKPGDSVIITSTIEVKSQIFSYNGKYVIGAKNEDAESLGETVIKIPAGIRAKVNQVRENGVELVDFDSNIQVPLEDVETGMVEDVTVYLNNIIFSNINIDQLLDEEK